MALVFGLFDAKWPIFKRNFNLYRGIQKHATPVETDTSPKINMDLRKSKPHLKLGFPDDWCPGQEILVCSPARMNEPQENTLVVQ